VNNTVEFLDTVKAGLRHTFEEFFYNRNKVDIDYNASVSDTNFRQAIRIIKKINDKQGNDINKQIKNSRTVEEFIEYIYAENEGNFSYCLQDISVLFNDCSNYLEDNLYEIEIVKVQCSIPPDLTYQNIVRDLNNCDKRIADKDYAGAITSAKTLVEGVCKEILNILAENSNDENLTLPKLFNNLSKYLNLDSSNKKFDKSLKEIISGFTKVIQGLTEVRNMSSDSHSKMGNPSFHHAVLAVNSAKTVASFLFHTYEYQKEKGKLQLVDK